MGKGHYEGKTNAAIQSGRRRAAEDGRAHDGRPCTPGNPRDLTVGGAKEILRDCMYDGMAVKTGNGYRQNIWGVAPEMGRRTQQTGERANGQDPSSPATYDERKKNGSGIRPLPPFETVYLRER